MIRVIPPFGIAVLVGVSDGRRHVVDAAGRRTDPGRGLVAGRHRRALAHRVPGPAPGVRFAEVRGDLAAAVVDLTEGAAELIAFGAVGRPGSDHARHGTPS